MHKNILLSLYKMPIYFLYILVYNIFVNRLQKNRVERKNFFMNLILEALYDQWNEKYKDSPETKRLLEVCNKDEKKEVFLDALNREREIAYAVGFYTGIKLMLDCEQ